jgi:hypothetical protein
MKELAPALKAAGNELLGWVRWALLLAAVAIAACFLLELYVWNVPHFSADTTSAIAGALAAYVGRK